MRYEGTVYRPPSEAGSLIIQATVGCPHNRCSFCGMYTDKPFRARPVKEVVEDLDMALQAYGAGVRTLFLADGNTAALPTDSLVSIGEAASDRFPSLERITVSDEQPFADYFGELKKVPRLQDTASKWFEPGSDEELAFAMELVLEALHQALRLTREDLDSTITFTELMKFNILRSVN